MIPGMGIKVASITPAVIADYEKLDPEPWFDGCLVKGTDSRGEDIEFIPLELALTRLAWHKRRTAWFSVVEENLT